MHYGTHYDYYMKSMFSRQLDATMFSKHLSALRTLTYSERLKRIVLDNVELSRPSLSCY